MQNNKLYFLSITIIIAANLSATTYYVNNLHPSADDQNPGTPALPFLTIQKGTDLAQAGDTLSISEGSYEGFTIHSSGTKNSKIVILGSANGLTLIESVEFAKDVSHILLSRFTIQGFEIWGVFLRGENHYISLNQLHVVGGESGIHLTYGYQAQDPMDGPVFNVLIENSRIQDCLYTAVDCTPGPCYGGTFRNLIISGAGLVGGESWGSDGIAIERGDSVIVENCVIHDNGGDGIDLNSRDFDGNVSGNVVRCNLVYRNHQNGIKLWGGGRMENNVVWGQGNTAVMLGAFPGQYEVVNNTIAYNMWDTNFGGRNYAFVAAYPEDETDVSASIQLRMINNIFAYNCNDDQGGPTGLYLGENVQLVQEGHNLFWSREDGEIQAVFLGEDVWISRQQLTQGDWATWTGQGQGNICAAPGFASGWPNFTGELSESSPAIDQGLSGNVPLMDYSGNPRPNGAGFDMGAYEFGSETSLPITSMVRPYTFQLFPAFPNPFNGMTTVRYSLDKAGIVHVNIYDIKGRSCCELVHAALEPGEYQYTWNGLDREGMPLPSGMYTIFLRFHGDRANTKLILMK